MTDEHTSPPPEGARISGRDVQLRLAAAVLALAAGIAALVVAILLVQSALG